MPSPLFRRCQKIGEPEGSPGRTVSICEANLEVEFNPNWMLRRPYGKGLLSVLAPASACIRSMPEKRTAGRELVNVVLRPLSQPRMN